MIRGDADVRGAGGDHAEDRRDDAAHRRDLAAIRVAVRRHREEVAEELVGAVDEVNLHMADRRMPKLKLGPTYEFGRRPAYVGPSFSSGIVTIVQQ